MSSFNQSDRWMRRAASLRGWFRERHISRRWWQPALAFAATRLGIALVAYLSTPLLIDSRVPPYHIRPDQVLLDTFGSRWDTGFYLGIAEQGYRYAGERLPSVAFFPLLPLAMRALAPLAGGALAAGLLLTNLALLGAALLFYRLVEAEWGEPVADRAVWYLLIFPTSFFGSAIYSEALFLFGAIGALLLARKGYWESAALLGALTALTRLVGILVAPLLFFEWLRQRRSWAAETRPPMAALLAPAAVPLGTGVYMLYLQRVFGDPLAFAHASAAWGRSPRSPLATIAELFQPPAQGWGAALAAGQIPVDNWIDFLFVLLFVGLGCMLLLQRRWGEGVFVLLGTLIPLSSGLLMSQRRYVWVLFPAFVLLARWGERPWVDRLVFMFSLLGLGLFTALFANWYWVA